MELLMNSLRSLKQYYLLNIEDIMKRNLSFFVVLFFAVSTGPYCLAAGSVAEESHKGYHHEMGGNDFRLSGKLENGIRIVEVKASQYKFEPDPIEVKLGEKVRLVVTSTDVAHGLAIDEFKINLSVSPQETKTVEFTADKKGTFHAYCNVYCGSGHGHMHASLIVK